MCEICDFQGDSNVGLKIHMSRKHRDVPQLDGYKSDSESEYTSYDIDTDCWWVNKFKNSLKPYQIFKQVLMDIDETPLSEEEKSSERDRVTAARKEVLGDNYIFFPPWCGK